MKVLSNSNRFICFSLGLTLILLSLSGASSVNAAPADLDGWTVTALRPAYVSEDQIVGVFTFEKVSGDDATRGGGACLVADLNDNFPCETRQDCLDAIEDGLVKPLPTPSPAPNVGYIYCDSLDGQEPKRCWTRPTGEGCTRSPTRTPNTYLTEPRSVLVDGEKVPWITLACMAVASNSGGCASQDSSQHIYSSSPALEPGFSCDEETNVCTPICGDGLLRGEESCDDANLADEDGCSAECTTESGYTCEGEPSQCSPDEEPNPTDDGEDSGVGGEPAGIGSLSGAGGCSLRVEK